jgi:hypothetical protein
MRGMSFFLRQRETKVGWHEAIPRLACLVWLGVGIAVWGAPAALAQSTGGICFEREDNEEEVRLQTPYCRSVTDNANPTTYLCWPQKNRSIVMRPRFDTCAKSCVGTTVASLTSALRGAMTTWNNVKLQEQADLCSDISLADGGPANTKFSNLFPPPEGARPDGQNVITWEEDRWSEVLESQTNPDGSAKYREPSKLLALTVTLYNPSTGSIQDADITFNGVDYQWTTDPNDTTGAKDVESVMLHELGHVIGFAHSNDTSSVMYYQSSAGSIQRQLNANDKQGLCWVYPSQKPSPGCLYVNQGQMRSDSPLACSAVAPHGRASLSGAWWSMLWLALMWTRARRSSRRPSPDRGCE